MSWRTAVKAIPDDLRVVLIVSMEEHFSQVLSECRASRIQSLEESDVAVCGGVESGTRCDAGASFGEELGDRIEAGSASGICLNVKVSKRDDPDCIVGEPSAAEAD